MIDVEQADIIRAELVAAFKQCFIANAGGLPTKQELVDAAESVLAKHPEVIDCESAETVRQFAQWAVVGQPTDEERANRIITFERVDN